MAKSEEQSLMSFDMPPVAVANDGWGPPAHGVLEGVCDFVEHLEKFPLSRVGRICDFTASGQRYAEQRAGKGKGKFGFGKGKGPVIQAGKDEEGFSLVDNRQLPGKSAGRGKSFGGKKGRGKGIQANYQEGILGQKQKPFAQNFNVNKGKGKGKGGNQRRGLPSFKDWSVMTKTEWEVKMEIILASLAKVQLDSREVKLEDVLWAGKLHNYNREFDRVTAKTERPLKRFEDLNFFNVSTSDDPHLPDWLQSEPDVTVIATDHVLACLVAAARSVYSWDVVVTKIQNKLIFDKRDGSQVDFWSVNETAQDPPNNDDTTNMNSPLKLGQEASCINQNFSQMVLGREAPKEMEAPNPFEDEEDGTEGCVASGAYRYRKITLPGDPKAKDDFGQEPVTMIVRCQVDCQMADGNLVSVKAMNEFDPKLASSWRTHLETQRGAVLATELKNNAFKLGRWTAQAILSGCETMKLGYVSRSAPNDPWSHTVLGVQTHITEQFADQIGMTANNMYGILRTIINQIMNYEDGKYLLLKDPTKSVMRIYAVPWETFGEGEEDDEEDQEPMQDLDEDGNVRPQHAAPMGKGNVAKPM